MRTPWLGVATLAVCAVLPAVAAKTPKQPLGIVNTAFQQYEDGPRMPSDEGYAGGELAFFQFEIAGYQKSEKEHIQLAWEWKCLDPSGIPLVPSAGAKVDTDVSPEDKDWTPKIRQNFEIPSYAPSGVYHLLITVKDELASAATNADLQFRVRGHNVGPVDVLAIRNFHFYREADDPQPVETAAYRPGESVWARFDIVGFKLGEGNAFEVSYGLTVIRPDGKPGYTNLNAATLKDKSFYPQRYAPAALSLTLPADVAKGDHTIVLTVHDVIGNQTVETQQKFSVE